MGFFRRIANLWKGFLSLFISDIEKDHPEIAYENSINSMVEKYTRLKVATAQIISRREKIEGSLRAARMDLMQAKADLNAAVDADQDEIALVLLQQSGTLDDFVAELEGEFNTAQTDSEEAKSSLLTVQSEINKLKTEKDRMLAKMQSANARIQINDQLSGLSVGAEIKALDGVRERIHGLQAQAGLDRELSNESFDGKLQAIRKQTKASEASKKLAELKAKRAAAQGQKASNIAKSM